MDSVSPDHPRQTLLFAIEGEPSDDEARLMRAVVDRLAAARQWTLGPPRFVDSVDDSSCTQPDDVPIRTVGLYVELYTGYPPWGARLPVSIDRAQYEEVCALVDELSQLTRSAGLEIVVEYDGDMIGDIENGAPDDGLADGLLGEWRRSLDARGA